MNKEEKFLETNNYENNELVEKDSLEEKKGLEEKNNIDINIDDFENEELKEKDKIELMGDLVRDKSSQHQLTNGEDFFEEPISLEVDEILSSIEELKLREEYSDIHSIKGKRNIYLFSDKYISNNYANMLVRVAENDLLKLIAETVREESKTYPRPTDAKLFSYNPFNFTKDQFYNVLLDLKTKEEYKDIKEIKASNGALYLYSEKHMTKAHATSLAEWIEVEQKQNP